MEYDRSAESGEKIAGRRICAGKILVPHLVLIFSTHSFSTETQIWYQVYRASCFKKACERYKEKSFLRCCFKQIYFIFHFLSSRNTIFIRNKQFKTNFANLTHTLTNYSHSCSRFINLTKVGKIHKVCLRLYTLLKFEIKHIKRAN